VYKNGSVEVIANEQGNRATPAYVAFTSKERVVGEAAYNHQHLNQSNTIYHAKSLLGYDFADPIFQKILEANKFPFEVSEGANKRPVVTVEFQGKPATFSPEELVGVLFKQMKQTASQYMGMNISKAVISVPAHYTERQKTALLEAAKLAELEVLSLCNEPAAIALAYKLDEPPAADSAAAHNHQNVVVVDMGGMSTNVTVLGVKDGIMEQLGFDQDTHLGGEHLDEALMAHFAKEFQRKNDGLDLTQSARAMTRLRHNSEKAKVVLSAAPNAPIEIDAVYEGVDLFSSISRARFETLCADFFKRITSALERALVASHVEKDDVHSLVITGGCGKIPRVRDVIKNFFGHKVKLLTGVQSVDEAVAYGCAIQASLIVTAAPEAAVSDLNEVKLTTLSIGVANAAGELQVLIPRNSPLPILKTIHTTVNGIVKGGLLELYEGEILRKASSNHLLASIALAKLEGTADMKLEISMDTDANIELQLTHSASRTRVNVHVPAKGADAKKQLDAPAVAALLEAGHKEHVELLAANVQLKSSVDALEARGADMQKEVSQGVVAGALTQAEQRIMNKAVDDITAWLANVSVGPIIHAKAEDLEKKQKGLELIFSAFSKKIEAQKAAPAAAAAAAPVVAAPVKKAPEPTPMPMMDTGDLD
jgi:heat shock protein 1/8